jgi:hypothetical protein
LLLDRNVGVAVAVHTSVRAVLVNPLTMALWGLIVAASLVGSSRRFGLCKGLARNFLSVDRLRICDAKQLPRFSTAATQ